MFFCDNSGFLKIESLLLMVHRIAGLTRTGACGLAYMGGLPTNRECSKYGKEAILNRFSRFHFFWAGHDLFAA